MKLLRKSQRLFLRIVLPVFVVAGIALYFALDAASNRLADRKLHDVRVEVEAFATKYDSLPVFFDNAHSHLFARPLSAGRTTHSDFFSDTLIYNEVEGGTQPFRCLHFLLPARKQVWEVTLAQSTIRHDELMWTVGALLLVLIGLLFLILAVVNQRVSKQVWTPFFATLEKMRLFRVAHAEPLHLADSEVDEFRELNATLASLVERVQNDFHTIKEFTENASHELQTPLAVIQNKVEALLQEESLSEVQMQQLDVIGQSARRMARLNHALLLLFKIGNNQFAERQSVDFKPLTEKKLRWLEDFIEEKNLRSEVVLTDKRVLMNVFLAETLVSNLLTNAVKHNLPGGLIRIHLHDKGLRIENTSPAPQVPAPELVARFARGNPRSEGVGLGLAIVQEICQQSDMHLFTEYAEGQWTAEVLF